MDLKKLNPLIKELGLYSKVHKDYLLIETEMGYIKYTNKGEIIKGD